MIQPGFPACLGEAHSMIKLCMQVSVGSWTDGCEVLHSALCTLMNC